MDEAEIEATLYTHRHMHRQADTLSPQYPLLREVFSLFGDGTDGVGQVGQQTKLPTGNTDRRPDQKREL